MELGSFALFYFRFSLLKISSGLIIVSCPPSLQKANRKPGFCCGSKGIKEHAEAIHLYSVDHTGRKDQIVCPLVLGMRKQAQGT